MTSAGCDHGSGTSIMSSATMMSDVMQSVPMTPDDSKDAMIMSPVLTDLDHSMRPHDDDTHIEKQPPVQTYVWVQDDNDPFPTLPPTPGSFGWVSDDDVQFPKSPYPYRPGDMISSSESEESAVSFTPISTSFRRRLKEIGYQMVSP